MFPDNVAPPNLASNSFLASPSTRLLPITTRYIHRLRFGIPIILFLLATVFETWEHWLKHDPLRLDFLGLAEIFIFGIVGPFAIYLVLTYVERLLEAVRLITEELDQLNQELEQKVASRTAELEQANLHLQELDQMKSDFVSLVSHELRAPLATLNGGVEVALQYKTQIPEKALRVLQLMRAETMRLTTFVQAILDMTQLEAGKLKVNCGPVALKPLLQQAVEMTLSDETDRVQWHIPVDVPPLWADETYTQEILRNLLRNAQKYTPPGSPIELAVEVYADHLCVSITDYGPGIPPERQGQVFERFGRIPHTGTSAAKNNLPRGWGLGLYFAHMLLQVQGGHITLQSPVREDKEGMLGCRFRVSLPLVNREEMLFEDEEIK